MPVRSEAIQRGQRVRKVFVLPHPNPCCSITTRLRKSSSRVQCSQIVALGPGE